MKNEDKMGTKNILPLLVEFSIPAIIGMLVNAIYNIVDRMFIGNAPELGAIGLAGISICYPVTLVLMAISLMIGMGGATRFSIALGQGKKEEAGKYMGNGGQWMNAPGYQTTHTPTEHSALSFSPGQAGADPTYGHIAFVEQVKSDGSILISESNIKGLGVVSYRTFDAETAKQITYVIGH